MRGGYNFIKKREDKDMSGSKNVLEKINQYEIMAKKILEELGVIIVSAREDYYQGIENLSDNLYVKSINLAKEKYGDNLDWKLFYISICKILEEAGTETELNHFKKYQD